MTPGAGGSNGLETRSLGALNPHGANARTHSDEQVAQVSASIVELGWTGPILIDGDGNVLAGHWRLMAAEVLGLSVPTVTRRWRTARAWLYRHLNEPRRPA